jgi:hypothetical protein
MVENDDPTKFEVACVHGTSIIRRKVVNEKGFEILQRMAERATNGQYHWIRVNYPDSTTERVLGEVPGAHNPGKGGPTPPPATKLKLKEPSPFKGDPGDSTTKCLGCDKDLGYPTSRKKPSAWCRSCYPKYRAYLKDEVNPYNYDFPIYNYASGHNSINLRIKQKMQYGFRILYASYNEG